LCKQCRRFGPHGSCFGCGYGITTCNPDQDAMLLLLCTQRERATGKTG
jgi:hypothetical protein